MRMNVQIPYEQMLILVAVLVLKVLVDVVKLQRSLQVIVLEEQP